ncbi:tyrosine-type recombinase/integrase [Neorhizobium tomejilense]|uniref:tyrosine-type recombinase/integrase n=1 Tax=Neorhizobium tomejilense TaxID=2093828 RepID=UPI003ECEFB98
MARVRIDGNTMAAAKNAAKKRESVEYRDTDAPGLAIRVKSGTAFFWCMTEHFKVSIAPVAYFTPEQLPTIRALIPKIKHAKKEGLDPTHLIAEVVGGEHDVELAENKAGLKDGEWSWEMLRDAYLEHVKKTLSHRSYTNAVSSLGVTEGGPIYHDFKPLLKMPIKSITPDDLKDVIDRMIERGRDKKDATKSTNYPQAILTYSAIRTCFSWAAKERKRSGLSANIAKLVDRPTMPTQDARDINPDTLVKARLASPKVLYRFAYHWMHEDRITKDCSKAALQLQMLTGQRIATVLRSFKKQFVRTPRKPWAYVWALGPDKMGAFRAIPLPELASSVVYEQLKRTREDNKFLFPQLKKGKGKDNRDGHLSDSTISDVTDRARAEGGPLPKTFAGSHDLRRAFTTHLGDWTRFGFASEKSVELVTHRNEGAESVSQAIYNLNPLLREKFKVLRAYQELLLRSYDPKFDGDYSPWELEDAFEYEKMLAEHSEEYFDVMRAEMEGNFDPTADHDPDD